MTSKHYPRQLAWRKANPVRYKKSVDKFLTSKKGTDYRRAQHLKAKYGLSMEDYERMLVAQGATCAMCKGSVAGGAFGRWQVDHNHVTGRIRGLLCDVCNRLVLPVVEHYTARIDMAKEYLGRTNI